jgi:hypothetical protein
MRAIVRDQNGLEERKKMRAPKSPSVFAQTPPGEDASRVLWRRNSRNPVNITIGIREKF